MSLLLKQLSLRIPKYCPKSDPTRKTRAPGEYLEWTITNETTAEMRRIYESKCGSKEAKKRLEVIDEDDIPIAERLQEKVRQFAKTFSGIKNKNSRQLEKRKTMTRIAIWKW